MREKKKKSSEKNTKFVGETLAFMLKTAAKEKPSLFFCYLGLFLAELAMNLKNILIPKFLIDELLLVIMVLRWKAICIRLSCVPCFWWELILWRPGVRPSQKASKIR